jgi:hypothetical protein
MASRQGVLIVAVDICHFLGAVSDESRLLPSLVHFKVLHGLGVDICRRSFYYYSGSVPAVSNYQGGQLRNMRHLWNPGRDLFRFYGLTICCIEEHNISNHAHSVSLIIITGEIEN